MFLNLFKNSEGVFKYEFRKQLLAALSVTVITFCHGIGIGWLSPMIAKLQSVEDTPLNFVISVEEASWVGAFVCVGGLIGNAIFGFLIDRIGRKPSIYCLAIPHICLWLLLYFATSIEFLYAARVCGGITGGGVYVVVPIYIGEIADHTIRGRLTSLFTLTMNTGILVGYIISSHIPYHLIPWLVMVLPLLYLLFKTFFPETPQHLLRLGRDTKAEQSLKFYRNYKGTNKEEIEEFTKCYTELRVAIMQQKSESNVVGLRDFFTKRSLKALCTGTILMLVYNYTGSFAIINYMSSIFIATGADLDPNTNTIIIGVVQIFGTYMATILVDRCGRKILLMTSTAAMGLSMAIFGMYAFVAEETDIDLTAYSSWLPLCLVAFIIFSANIGIIPVPFVVIVEIMPPKIRARAAAFCVFMLSIFAFTLLKGFPVFMHVFGLSATMWFCATVAAIGLFYITVFLKETKGKSVDKVEEADD